MIFEPTDRLSCQPESLLEQFFSGKIFPAKNFNLNINGRKLRTQRIRDCHADDIAYLLKNLEERSKRFRFCSDLNHVADEFFDNLAQATVKRCQVQGYGLIVFDSETGNPVAMSQYVSNGARSAEFCITIADAWQGNGLGKILTERIMKRAKIDGISYMEAVVAHENAAMKLILMRSGYRFSKAYYPNCSMYKLYLG